MKRGNLEKATEIDKNIRICEQKLNNLRHDYPSRSVYLHNGINQYITLPDGLGFEVIKMLETHLVNQIAELEKELETL